MSGLGVRHYTTYIFTLIIYHFHSWSCAGGPCSHGNERGPWGSPGACNGCNSYLISARHWNWQFNARDADMNFQIRLNKRKKGIKFYLTMFWNPFRTIEQWASEGRLTCVLLIFSLWTCHFHSWSWAGGPCSHVSERGLEVTRARVTAANS